MATMELPPCRPPYRTPLWSAQKHNKKDRFSCLRVYQVYAPEAATYSRAMVDTRGLVPGLSPQVLAAQVRRRGAFHVQRPTQATVGKHGVADTCAERQEREVKVRLFQSQRNNLISDTLAASRRKRNANFSFQPESLWANEQLWFSITYRKKYECN